MKSAWAGCFYRTRTSVRSSFGKVPAFQAKTGLATSAKMSKESVRRFFEAQEQPYLGGRAKSTYFEGATRELAAGQKQGHWIWFIFPQVSGLGSSQMAQDYSIQSLEEANDYLDDPILGARLVQCMEVVKRHVVDNGVSLDRVFGTRLDALKFISSVTLFKMVWEARDDKTGAIEMCSSILAAALKKGIKPCNFTTNWVETRLAEFQAFHQKPTS